MLHPSTQQLIRKLCELTDAGHIAWKEGERECSRFESEGYVVEVEAEPPTLRLLRGDGRELERADASDLAAAPWPEGSGTFATHVADMATKAHRVARGAEDAIARILSSLSSPPKVDAEPAPPAPHTVPPPEPARVAPPKADTAIPLPVPATSAPKAAFGAVDSFDKTPGPDSTPKPAAPVAAPPILVVKGFSARSVQTPESGTVAAVAARPPEKQAPPPPSVSVYKPWN